MLCYEGLPWKGYYVSSQDSSLCFDATVKNSLLLFEVKAYGKGEKQNSELPGSPTSLGLMQSFGGVFCLWVVGGFFCGDGGLFLGFFFIIPLPVI